MLRIKLVVIESPFAGDREVNSIYARACMRHCLQLGEAPFASHMLYTQPGVLDDDKVEERALGIEAGLAWGGCADVTAAYVDLGVSKGMQLGIDRAKEEGRPVEQRKLPPSVLAEIYGEPTDRHGVVSSRAAYFRAKLPEDVRLRIENFHKLLAQMRAEG